MAQFLLGRLVQSIVLIIGVSIIGFSLMQLSPGGPLAVYTLNPTVTAQDIARIKVIFGLDQPAYVQYLKWASNLLIGNWGFSFFGGRPVAGLVLERIPATLLLMGTSLTLAMVIGVAVGILGAVRRYSVFDYLATTWAMLALSLPTFWFGLVAIYVFAVQLGWFPAGGFSPLGGPGGLLDALWHLVLPAGVLALVLVAQWSRYARSAMLDVLNQDFMRTARAKGLSASRILFGHGLRAALVPLVTLLGLQIPLLLGGALVTETVFSWPGMGLLFVNSLSMRDYPVLMAILMLSSVAVVVGNLGADLVNALIDPRIKLAGGRPVTDLATTAALERELVPVRGRALRRFGRHRLAVAGAIVIAIMIVATVFAGRLAPYDPLVLDVMATYGPPLTPGHLLGTDDLGRDVLSRLLYAGRISLSVGLSAMAVTVLVGALVGAFAAYLGGWVGAVLMRLTDMVLCFPNIFLLLFIAAFVRPTLFSLVLIIGLTSWMEIARIVYGQVLSLKRLDFVLAARLSGASSRRIVFRQLLPNTLAPILVAASLNTANAILLESYISFLGYGIQPPAASWGNMLTNAQSDLVIAPWLAIFPGLAITIAVTSFNFVGDGIRDSLDVRL